MNSCLLVLRTFQDIYLFKQCICFLFIILAYLVHSVMPLIACPRCFPYTLCYIFYSSYYVPGGLLLLCIWVPIHHKKKRQNKIWWRHQIETFSALLAFCAGNSPVTGEFPAQSAVTRSFDIFFICAWINAWANNREAGDLRRHRAHYEVIVTKTAYLMKSWPKIYPDPGLWVVSMVDQGLSQKGKTYM